jgi:peptidoglycan/LPS O-acetylase OafA/YrhL
MTNFGLLAKRTQPRAVPFALALTILALLVISFAAVRDFAVQAGIPEHLAWLFPVLIDGMIAGSIIAMLFLRHLQTTEQRAGAEAKRN